MMSETVVVPAHHLDGPIGKATENKVGTDDKKMTNGDATEDQIQASVNKGAVLPLQAAVLPLQEAVLPLQVAVGITDDVRRDREDDTEEAVPVEGDAQFSDDLKKKDADEATEAADKDGPEADDVAKNDGDKVVNGDMRAPLAEQEQEDEGEQDDEVLSSIEEQLEFGDDDMNDLNADDEAYNDSADEGSDSDFEDIPYPSSYVVRDDDPDLPDTVTKLISLDGCKVYLVGTAHFSQSSQDDVAKTISATHPDIVMVELCKARMNILHMDEELILKEAQDMSLAKIRQAIRQSGLLQGIMHLLLLSMSAHLTKELGMAPGGEFRRAYHEAQHIHGCRIHLGDRPISITLSRALGSLSVWQKARLAWHIIMSNESITKEDVERCKQKDLLEEMLREMTGEFPALSEVFVSERDLFLANSLQLAARPVPHPTNGQVPSVVVGVVGIGHVPGIIEHWNKPIDISKLLTVPPPSYLGGTLRWGMRAALVGMISWGCYKVIRFSSSYVL